MFRKIPFVESELETIGEIPGIFGRPGTPIRNTPVSPRENMAALYYEKKPYWLPVSLESRMFSSQLYSTRLSRGSGKDQTDVFGIEWEYVPAVGGSIVRPGSPFLEDVNEWKEKVIIPDVESWPWKEEAKDVKLDPRFSHEMSFVNGFWFERLISFMDFSWWTFSARTILTLTFSTSTTTGAPRRPPSSPWTSPTSCSCPI